MHIPTHIMAGWVVANLAPLTPRERLACMIAGAVADLDGLGILISRDLYDRWHHVALHGLPAGIVFSIALSLLFSRGRKRQLGCFAMCLLAFHLHLLMDYFGSGPGWPIVYLYPFSDFKFMNWQSWELSSWQNTLAAAILLACTIAIAFFKKRTPLEVLMPSLDAQLVRKKPEQGREFDIG